MNGAITLNYLNEMIKEFATKLDVNAGNDALRSRLYALKTAASLVEEDIKITEALAEKLS